MLARDIMVFSTSYRLEIDGWSKPMNGSNMQYLQRNLSIYEGYLNYVKDKYIQSLVIKMNIREKSDLKK